ncbi:MAG: hypothetical protein LBP34_06010, partial [Flavobacteriaceae bacterium]|nr:hypothetical protein [Flavobacteriaceae bacterium]
RSLGGGIIGDGIGILLDIPTTVIGALLRSTTLNSGEAEWMRENAKRNSDQIFKSKDDSQSKVGDNNSKSNDSKGFGGESDAESETSRGAFRKAKDQNKIPRGQQPEKTEKVPDKNTGESLTEYTFKNSDGKTIKIRQDKPIKYKDGGEQGPHYNAGNPNANNGKLKQHHNYKRK